MPKSSPPIAAEAVEALARELASEHGEASRGSNVYFEARARNLLAAASPAIWHSFEEALLGEESVEAAARERLMRDRVEALGRGEHIPVWDDLAAEQQAERLHAERQVLAAALQAIRGEQG